MAGFDNARAIPVDYLAALLGGARIEPVPIPHDCTDGFAAAYWRRPAALDAGYRLLIAEQ